MVKSTCIVLFTWLLFYHAASKQERFADVEKTFGNDSCWERLGQELDEACQKTGDAVSGVETVDFSACQMGCKEHAVGCFRYPVYNIPNDTRCGISCEKCKKQEFENDCQMPTEEIEEIWSTLLPRTTELFLLSSHARDRIPSNTFVYHAFSSQFP